MAAEYDYVIIGGGTAGLVVAARLSEDPSKKVAVIEAGANRKGDPRIDIPGLALSLYEDTDYDWSFLTEPQAALNGRQIACPRGRVLGGSSALNFSAVLYPSKADFDDWAEINDDQSWNADAMALYLRKFHTFRPASEATKQQMALDYMDESNQGTNGPLQVTIPDGYSPFHEAWVKGFKELGFHAGKDPIDGKTIGCFTNPVSIHPETKAREYSASSYYTPDVEKRANLHVLTESVVEKIVWAEGVPLRALGVQMLQNGTKRDLIRIRDGGEVILSAGAIKSPQILELSGVGDERLLKQHGIPTRINNPGVGENLQDHVVSSISYEINDDQMSGDHLKRDPELLQAVLGMYQATKSGPMSGTMLGTAYLPPVDKDGAIDKAELLRLVDEHLSLYPDFPAKAKQYELLRRRLTDSAEPSVEFLFIPMQVNNNAKNTMQYLFGSNEPGNYVSAVPLLNHPFSRGTVHITSADPQANPAIDPRYLSHPLDLELQARHTQYLERLVQTTSMQSVLKKDGRRLPATDPSNLEAARQIARDRAFTCFHPSGTCPMMPRELGGVVDSRLVVHGTKNVRVVDASIFPLEPLGNIQAAVYAVAEKASDLIKAAGSQ